MGVLLFTVTLRKTALRLREVSEKKNYMLFLQTSCTRQHDETDNRGGTCPRHFSRSAYTKVMESNVANGAPPQCPLTRLRARFCLFQNTPKKIEEQRRSRICGQSGIVLIVG